MKKFSELLAQYGKTADDIAFDYSAMTDEELEAKFKELFESEGNSDSDNDADDGESVETGDFSDAGEVSDNASGTDTVENDVSDDEDEPKKKDDNAQYSVTYADKENKCFSLSLDDIQCQFIALAQDIGMGDCFVIPHVYPDESFVVYEDACTGKGYRYSFERNGNNYSLKDGKVEVKQVWVSSSEEAKIDEMRRELSAALVEIEGYKKNEILNSGKYSIIMDTDEVKGLLAKENAANFAAISSDELKAKLNEVVVKYATSGKLNFSAGNSKVSSSVRLPVDMKGNDSKSPYGDLLRKYRK